jgi:ribosomal protein S18 acetylase RimI-like enzyme
MNQDPFETAYALGDLESSFWEQVTFWTASQNGAIVGLVMFYTGFEVPVLSMHGQDDALESILEGLGRGLPPEVYCLMPARHAFTLDIFYALPYRYDFVRMALTPEKFCPSPRPLPDGLRMVACGAGDAPRLNALYASAAHPSEAVLSFSPSQIALGAFYGVENQDGELVAAAGTHVASVSENIAAVGNVFTAPGARGQGLGGLTTSYVVQALFRRGISRVVLNVKADNGAARSVYKKLGFWEHSTLIEGTAFVR